MTKLHIPEDDVQKIVENTSVVDYFFYLEQKNRVKFDRQRGHDYYFVTDNEKFSVDEKGYYDFKAGKGGKIIKAVMQMEGKNWLEAVNFLKDFSNTTINQSAQTVRDRRPAPTQHSNTPHSVITNIVVPNNDKLLEYFAQRGISKEILQQYTQQVHYRNIKENKDYFGIGIPNQSGGYDIRNPYIKAKVGASDMTVIPGTRNEAVVFEGMTDMLSYLQMAKDNGKPNDRTLVVLNSVTNTGTFIERFKNYTGKIHLFLDGDKAGDDATQSVLNNLKNSIDKRGNYGIGKGEINDLNDYHLKVFNYLHNSGKSRTFASENNIQNNSQNGSITTEPDRVSSPKPVGEQSSEPNLREPLSPSQTQQDGNNPSRQTVGSNNVGNGLSIWEDEKEDPKWAAIEEHNRKYYHLKTLFQEGKAEELEQIFLTETNPDLKEVARHFFLELEDLPH